MSSSVVFPPSAPQASHDGEPPVNDQMSNKSKPNPVPAPDPANPKFREHVIQRLIRDNAPPEGLAEEFNLDVALVKHWKSDFLSKLQTATKAPVERPQPTLKSPVSENKNKTQVIVQDLSKKRLHSDDRKGPTAKPFPVQSSVKLSSEERAKLEKTQGLIISEGKVSIDVGRKLGMLPKEHYEKPASGLVPKAEAPIPQPPNNRSMEDASRERFAANWRKVGGESVAATAAAGTAEQPPMVVPPPPMKLTLHERLLTTLQRLPGISWLLRGGRFDSAPWLLVLLLLMIIATVLVLMKEHQESFVSDVNEEATPLYLRPLAREEIQSAESLIREFYRADTVEALKPLIRTPETLAPILAKQYVNGKVDPIEIYAFDGARRELIHGKNFTIHGVKFSRLKRAIEVPVEHLEDGSRVDWEMATNYQAMSWHALRTTKPTGTAYFRARLQPSTYYGKQPFHDSSIFRSFRITHPDEGRVMNGYAMLDTDVELKLRELIPEERLSEEGVPQGVQSADVIIGVNYPSNATQTDLVEITEMPSNSWVMDYEPGDVHFDQARSMAILRVELAEKIATQAAKEAAAAEAEKKEAARPAKPVKKK